MMYFSYKEKEFVTCEENYSWDNAVIGDEIEGTEGKNQFTFAHASVFYEALLV